MNNANKVFVLLFLSFVIGLVCDLSVSNLVGDHDL